MKKIGTFREIRQIIKKDSVLFFDMDGTLIDTDFANYLSYRDSVKTVLEMDINYDSTQRFNRTLLKTIVPNLTEAELKEIIRLKEKNYNGYLPYTKLIKSSVDILNEYYKVNKTVLVTNCREDRASMTLRYHDLEDKFSTFFFRQTSQNGDRMNKYENVISELNIPVQKVIVFENEMREINDAIKTGISIKNIINF